MYCILAQVLSFHLNSLKLPSFEWGQGSLPRGTEREQTLTLENSGKSYIWQSLIDLCDFDHRWALISYATQHLLHFMCNHSHCIFWYSFHHEGETMQLHSIFLSALSICPCPQMFVIISVLIPCGLQNWSLIKRP